MIKLWSYISNIMNFFFHIIDFQVYKIEIAYGFNLPGPFNVKNLGNLHSIGKIVVYLESLIFWITLNLHTNEEKQNYVTKFINLSSSSLTSQIRKYMTINWIRYLDRNYVTLRSQLFSIYIEVNNSFFCLQMNMPFGILQ